MNKDIKVGLFVSFGLALMMIAILVLGGSESVFKRKTYFITELSAANGLLIGSKVVLSGIPVGNISDISYNPKSKKVAINYHVEKKYADLLLEGTSAELLTQGVLGDKYIGLNAGDGPTPLKENAKIPYKPTQDFSQILSKSDQLMVNINLVTENLNKTLEALHKNGRLEAMMQNFSDSSKNLNSATKSLADKDLGKAVKELSQVIEKINKGNGTIGSLINDPSLYDEMRSLVGTANRNRIIRNLVRQSVQENKN